ncbi:DHH family phosphoesterase [Candidatus Peregrinibacteria bacterium]|nr:DHH family phosphoesterase [Candidatus Peregrinibacteria bacterium]
MPLSQAQLDTISVIKKATNVLILPSSPIDGDSIGSALSFYLALKKLGKKVTVVAEEAVPQNYNFLPEISAISREMNFVRDLVVTLDCRGSELPNVRHEIQGDKINIIVTPKKGGFSREQVSFSQSGSEYDCVIVVDAADPSQLGKLYDDFTELFNLAPVINIDHHTSNLSFGKINLVDIMASSTTTIILPLIEELGQGLMDANIATLLLAGLITDTGSFQNPNTTPNAFSIAAKLISYGARQQEIIRNIYKTKKLSTLRLWGRTLSKIQYDEKHKMVWSVLTARDFDEIGGLPDETEGVIDELMSNAPGAEIVFLLKERGSGEIGGSIRTLSGSIDASKLAGMFGGGGHLQAAGFRVKGKQIPDVEKEVVEAFRKFQKERLRLPEENEDPTTKEYPKPTPQPKPIPVVLPTVKPVAEQASIAPKPQPQQIAKPLIATDTVIANATKQSDTKAPSQAESGLLRRDAAPRNDVQTSPATPSISPAALSYFVANPTPIATSTPQPVQTPAIPPASKSIPQSVQPETLPPPPPQPPMNFPFPPQPGLLH